MAAAPATAALVTPGATCPWGAADLSWAGAPEDQLYRCTHGPGKGVALEVLQSGGVEAAKEEDGKSLADDARLGNTGLVVWYSAPMLCRYIGYLHDRGELEMRGASVLDLGAGTGLLGLCCACYGAAVVLSDFAPPVLALLHVNATTNIVRLSDAGAGSVHVALYDWRLPFPLDRERVMALSAKRTSECQRTSAAGATAAPAAAQGSGGDDIDSSSIGSGGGGGGTGETATGGCFDYIVGTDILFSAEVVPVLVQVLAALCDASTRVLLGTYYKSKHNIKGRRRVFHSRSRLKLQLRARSYQDTAKDSSCRMVERQQLQAH